MSPERAIIGITNQPEVKSSFVNILSKDFEKLKAQKLQEWK